MTEPTTPYRILATHYGTHSANRLTSNEEFNKDAEYMTKVKRIFLNAERKWREEPTEYRRAIANIIKRWAFKQSQILKAKTWGTTSTN